jgi:hypothetical protein
VTESPPPDTQAVPETARLVPGPVDSVEGVPGRYVQPFALPGQVNQITLAQPNYGVGSYELYRSCGVPDCVPQSGQYNIIPTNPAIGFAALTLVDQTGTVRVTYVLDYLWRDADGQLVAIQLRTLLGNAPGPTQVWWRMPDDSAPETRAPTRRTVASTPPAEPTTIEAAAAKPALAGVYVRALPIYGDISALTLDDASWIENTANGAYDAAYPYCLPWCLGEAGDYQLDVANDTTGTGQLSLVPAANVAAAHDYAVYAIWRTPEGTPAAIQLQRFDGVVASGPPFTLYRQWWTGTAAAAAPATPDSCAMLASLAAYYRIRALQCGMGACWPLSGWYSAGAQYYDGLAAAQGCPTQT